MGTCSKFICSDRVCTDPPNLELVLLQVVNFAANGRSKCSLQAVQASASNGLLQVVELQVATI